MCFHSKQSKTAQELENRFNAKVEKNTIIEASIYNGFQNPYTPIITNKNTNIIELYSWGLIPHWAKDTSIRQKTLNARIETIHEKPSFKYSLNKRCLILVDGFFEWKWLDEKGKQKEKYLITLTNQEAFALAGLYNEWVDKTTGEILNTYTILTEEANTFMAEIHNSKKRMPVILNPNDEKKWLDGENYNKTNIDLQAMKI